MSIISTIGRKSLKVRVLIWSIYLVLTLGAVSMIYPFWLMISGTGKSAVDVSEMDLIPAYLRDDDAYYRKAVSSLLNESPVEGQALYDMPIADFKTMKPPQTKRGKLAEDWVDFLTKGDFPFYYYQLGHSRATASNTTQPENFRNFKNRLFKEAKGDIDVMNKAKNTDFKVWHALYVNESPFFNRRSMPNMTAAYNVDWYGYKKEAPKHHRIYVNPSGYFKGSFLYPQYTKNIESYNKQHGTKYTSYDQIKLSRRFPANATKLEQHDWEYYVREVVNLFWVRIDPSAQKYFTEFLQVKYNNNLARLNAAYKEKFKSFSDVKLLTEIPFPYHSTRISDFNDFLKGWADPTTIDSATGKPKLFKAPIRAISLCGVEMLFRDYLKAKYKTVANLNKEMGTFYPDFSDINPPQYEYHYKTIMAEKGKQRWEFATRNFLTVIDYILLQGRALFNTSVYCVLAVLCALIFNPLAAYALSRFQLPSTYKVLLFLMLTMAFPQMVTQIPNFLMMRELGLLNTFGALILPGLANGYSIFLLKGFFDSLPKELYESAMLDGAGETRIFLQITMSLSKPILAVIALSAFTSAYSNFMMALLICQDQQMWTLMPWLYQLQQTSCQAIIYASLIVASIPTFLIFMLCQNVIMRGIVVPVEK